MIAVAAQQDVSTPKERAISDALMKRLMEYSAPINKRSPCGGVYPANAPEIAATMCLVKVSDLRWQIASVPSTIKAIEGFTYTEGVMIIKPVKYRKARELMDDIRRLGEIATVWRERKAAGAKLVGPS